MTYLIQSNNKTESHEYALLGTALHTRARMGEMAYAYSDGNPNKYVKIPSAPVAINYQGTTYNEIETVYGSTFSDGTKVTIIHRSQGLDIASNTLVPDHISLFSIDFNQ